MLQMLRLPPKKSNKWHEKREHEHQEPNDHKVGKNGNRVRSQLGNQIDKPDDQIDHRNEDKNV